MPEVIFFPWIKLQKTENTLGGDRRRKTIIKDGQRITKSETEDRRVSRFIPLRSGSRRTRLGGRALVDRRLRTTQSPTTTRAFRSSSGVSCGSPFGSLSSGGGFSRKRRSVSTSSRVTTSFQRSPAARRRWRKLRRKRRTRIIS